MWQNTVETIGALWCSMTHNSVMWPIHGRYQCRTCGRRYPALAEPRVAASIDAAAFRRSTRSSMRIAGLLVGAVIALQVAAPVRADDLRDAERASANAAFERYAAEQTETWNIERVEISAALPKLRQAARFEAIRTLAQGEPKYEVLALTGDTTVRNQVIVRYLKAEEQASQAAPALSALSGANYRIAYRGLTPYAGGVAYVFQLTPRKKRQGLIKGELWLDTETGAAVRESGYFVKSPSVWIKRIYVTRENAFRDRTLEARHTEVTVETRLVGRAELVIEERPVQLDDGAESEGQQ